MLLVALGLHAALAAEVTIRNDTSYDDTYDTSDNVGYLVFPECAISVFDPADYDLPVEVDTLQVFLASNTGNYKGADIVVEVMINFLDEGEDPHRGDEAWGEEAFYGVVSNDQLNELSLVDEDNGLYAVDWTDGYMAVWICAPETDPWPEDGARDVTGVVIDSSSPSKGSWLCASGGRDCASPLSDFGAKGSWIIRAIGYDSGSGNGSGGEGGEGGNGGSGDTATEGELELLSINPASAGVGEAVSVALVGAGFEDGATVYIGGLQASQVSVAGDSAITAVTPTALPEGTHDVWVTNPNGDTATLASGFTVFSGEGVKDEGGCGCSTGGDPIGELALAGVLFGLAWGRRRRED